MQIGDIVVVYSEILWMRKTKGTVVNEEIAGRIIWQHPKDRFYLVEFCFNNSKVYECFRPGEIRRVLKWTRKKKRRSSES